MASGGNDTTKQAGKKGEFKYDAFISYSHAADGKLAPALQRSLHRIAKPFYKLRALNIFRDQTNLSVTPHLWETIENALRQSRFLIYMASPGAAQSRWVQKEILFWLQNKSVESILIGLTDGEIFWDEQLCDFDWQQTSALPVILKGKFRMEPLFVDLRNIQADTSLSIDNPIFKEKTAIMAAAIHEKPVGDLIGEDVNLLRKSVRLRNTAIALLSALFLGVLVFAWLSNINAKRATLSSAEAKKQERLALQRGDSLAQSLSISDSLIILEQRERKRADANAAVAQQNEQLAIQRQKTAEQLQRAAETEAEANRLAALSYQVSRIDRTKALRIAEKAWKVSPENVGAIQVLHEMISVKPPLPFYSRIFHDPRHRPSKIALSPDQSILLTGGYDSLLGIWNKEGKLLRILNEHKDNVYAVDFSNDGKRFLSAGADSLLIVWDAKNYSPLSRIPHGSKIYEAKFLNNQQIISGTDKGVVSLFKINGELIKRATINGDVTNIDISEDRKKIAVCTSISDQIVIYDSNLSIISDLKCENCYPALFRPGHNEIVINGDKNSFVKILDFKGNIIKTLFGQYANYHNFTLSPKGDYILGSTGYPLAKFIMMNYEGDVIQEFDGIGSANSFSILYSKDGNSFYADVDNKIVRWDLHNNYSDIIQIKMGEIPIERAVVKLMDDDRRLIVGSSEGALILDEEGRVIQRFNRDPMEDIVTSIAVSPKTGHLFLGNFFEVSMWKLNGKLLWKHRDFSSSPSYGHQLVTFSKEGDKVAFVNFGGKISILDTLGKKINIIDSRQKRINALESSSKSNMLIAAGYEIKIFNWEGGLIRTIPLDVECFSIKLSKDDKKIIIGCADNSAKLLSIEGKLLQEFFGHSNGVYACGFSHDGRYIVTGSSDQTAKLWDLNGNELQTFIGHNSVVSSVSLPEDGQLITGSWDGSVKKWILRDDYLKSDNCARFPDKDLH